MRAIKDGEGGGKRCDGAKPGQEGNCRHVPRGEISIPVLIVSFCEMWHVTCSTRCNLSSRANCDHVCKRREAGKARQFFSFLNLLYLVISWGFSVECLELVLLGVVPK